MKPNSISAALAVHARTIATARYLLVHRGWLSTGLLALAAIALRPRAQAAVTEAWVQRYGSQAGSEDRASKVVTDAAGDIIVAGSAGKQIGSDLRVIKYSGAGVRLWAKRYNGPVNDYDEPSAMAVDGNGNVFVSGYSLASGGQ